MEQTQADSGVVIAVAVTGDVEIAAAVAAAIDAADEGDAADPTGPEQGGEGEPAGGVEVLLQQILNSSTSSKS